MSKRTSAVKAKGLSWRNRLSRLNDKAEPDESLTRELRELWAIARIRKLKGYERRAMRSMERARWSLREAIKATARRGHGFDPAKAPLRAGMLANLTGLWMEVHPAAWEYRCRAEGPGNPAPDLAQARRAEVSRKRGRVIARISPQGRVRSYLSGLAVSG